MTPEDLAKRLARNAINQAIVNHTEGRRDITMMKPEDIDEAIEILLAEDDKYIIQAKRNLGLLFN